MENEPLGKRGSPFAVGVFAWTAVGLSLLIYRRQGTWPAESGGWAAAFLFLVGLALVSYAWRTDSE